jgi:hypothetical protein
LFSTASFKSAKSKASYESLKLPVLSLEEAESLELTMFSKSDILFFNCLLPTWLDFAPFLLRLEEVLLVLVAWSSASAAWSF